jgi:integrase
MPTKNLTDLFCERVKPPEHGRIEYFDASFGGLALRVTEGGHKSFSVHFRLRGKLKRYTLGTFPTLKPAQARRDAAAALELARNGTDPTAAKRELRYAPAPEDDTFRAVLADYLERHMAKNTAGSTYAEAKRSLEKDVLPKWKHRPIGEITRRDVIALIDGIAARGAEVHANRIQARLRAMFNWAAEKGRLAASPIEGMKLTTKEQPRDRVLSDEEIRWLWTGCEEVGWPFGPLANMLLLTAQRRDEVAGMQWCEIDLERKTWIIPREKAKNNRAHEVQLSDAAMGVLRSLPRIGKQFVFSTTGDRPVSGFTWAKQRIDAAMAKARDATAENHADRSRVIAAEIAPWIFHDLRRTAATGMARLSIAPHVVDKVLNHVSGTIRGVAAVYNRFEYLNERRHALEQWGAFVSTVSAQRGTLPPSSEPHSDLEWSLSNSV